MLYKSNYLFSINSNFKMEEVSDLESVIEHEEGDLEVAETKVISNNKNSFTQKLAATEKNLTKTRVSLRIEWKNILKNKLFRKYNKLKRQMTISASFFQKNCFKILQIILTNIFRSFNNKNMRGID